MAERTPSFLPTPPDSPRKRRRHLRESDETNGWMSLERYLYRTDPYRSTTVTHPLPYPLSIEPANDAIKRRISQYHTHIEAILSDYGFHGPHEIDVNVVTKPGYPGGDQPVVALRINCWRAAVIPRVPGEARDRIYELLARNGISIDIEIVDSQNCFRPSLFAIKPDDQAVAPFEQARGRLIGVLTRELGERWSNLCLFNVGSFKEKATASIVVMVDPGTNCDWSGLRFSMLREVGHDPNISLQVEFLPGEASPLLTSVPRSLQPEQDTDEGIPPLSQLDKMDRIGRLQRGMSIGLRGEEGGGTMGGFVTITRGRVTHRGILTSYDVVRPSIPASTVIETDRKGISIDRPNCPKIEIIYPATKDARATKEDAKSMLEQTKTRLNGMIQRKDNRKLVGKEVKTAELKRIEDVEKAYDRRQQTLQAVQGMPTRIGEVEFASGMGVSGATLLDWAFVEITEPEAQKFFRCDQVPQVPVRMRPCIDTSKQVHFSFQEEPLNGIGVMEKGEYYAMVGRTSGTQTGICNGTQASCHWRKNHIRYDEFGEAVDAAQITHEYVIINEMRKGNKTFQDPFCQPGDSGAFMINTKGEVCGLLYGYLDTYVSLSDYIYSGLATCMGSIKLSIQALTTPRDAQGRPTGIPVELGLF
ncbi:hypothetical protein DTO271D3_3240 [Paecilomyces variotii]|nr:hypothetical protein DTO271D3_3240 [Paecilomyces variotii]